MTKILIRKAQLSDLSSIKKLVTKLVDSLANTKDIDSNQVANNLKTLFKDLNSYIFVAEIKGTITGFINFTIRKTISHRGLSGLIDELVVSKKFQGKGIGNQLVLTAIKKCRQLGCCEVEVSTEKTNIKARDFYKKCGFEERGLLFELDLYIIDR